MRATATLGCLAVMAITGCTAVLGIHSAELDDAGTPSAAGTTGSGTAGSSTSGTSGTGGGTNVCGVVAPSCVSCLRSSCQAALDTCLARSECRTALDSYTKCLPSSCMDTGNACAEKIADQSQELALCLAGTCSSPCTGSTAVSRCELYCACMKGYCPTDFAASLGNTHDACLSACGALRTERDVNCRWNHCEFAGIGTAGPLHCSHAIALPTDVCNSVSEPQRKVCTSGQESGFPCHLDSECCSSKCPAGACQ